MPRPVVNPNILFADVIRILEAAQSNGGGLYECESPSMAISKMHRCNMARKRIRDNHSEGICVYDAFVIRTEGRWLRIEPRGIFDPAKFKKLDDSPAGQVVSPEEAIRIGLERREITVSAKDLMEE